MTGSLRTEALSMFLRKNCRSYMGNFS